MSDGKIPNNTAFIRHGPWCPDGTWAALPFWLMLPAAQRARLEELLGESADFDWEEAKAADPEWAPNLRAAQEEGLPLFIAAKPGDYPPQGLLEGYTVYLLDYCYTAAALEALLREIGPGGRVVILDHHETNQRTVERFVEEHPGQITAVFDMSRSGAEIAWAYAREHCEFDEAKHPTSRIMEYVGDRDTWKFALPDSKEVNAALRTENVSSSLGRAVAAYERELAEPAWIGELATQGRHYLAAQDEIVRAIASAARTAYVSARDPETGKPAEYRVRVVNAPTLQSEIGHVIAGQVDDEGELPHMAAVWYYTHAKDEIRVSLRTNRGDVNLSKIAPTIVGILGGGGHPAAAGCSIKGSDVKAIFRSHPLARADAAEAPAGATPARSPEAQSE